MYEDRMTAGETSRKEQDRKRRREALSVALRRIIARHSFTLLCIERSGYAYGHVARVTEDPKTHEFVCEIVVLTERETPELEAGLQGVRIEMQLAQRPDDPPFSLKQEAQPKPVRPS